MDAAIVEEARDGWLWANWPEADDDHWRVGHLGPTDWEPLDGYARSAWLTADFGSGPVPNYTAYDRLFLSDAGELYGAECWTGSCFLHRYEDGDWFGEDQFGAGYFNVGHVLDVGPDGTVWLDGGNCHPARGIGACILSRFADGEWTDWTFFDLPDIGLGLGLDYEFEVAPDGSLWSSLWSNADGDDARLEVGWWERRSAVEDGHLVCDGLVRFDGKTLDHFLPGRCITMDIAADGSVWVVSDDDLYVITPEAVAASD